MMPLFVLKFVTLYVILPTLLYNTKHNKAYISFWDVFRSSITSSQWLHAQCSFSHALPIALQQIFPLLGGTPRTLCGLLASTVECAC